MKKNTTLFARYYESAITKKLIEVSMSDMQELIADSQNKKVIAKHIYERLYCRFLKIFDYRSEEMSNYNKNDKTESLYTFNEEFKNGFLQLAACSILIETLAAYISGNDTTPNGKNKKVFENVFTYAQEKDNELKVFNNEFYSNIRCGILHQGETKETFTITRKKDNPLLDEENKKINAYKFHRSLKKLLKSYQQDLETEAWDSEIWNNCRTKIWYIIKNS